MSKEKCDWKFVVELENLSHKHLAPLRMHNAHSWFRPDGFFGAQILIKDEIWAASASCEGGDGRAARFYCHGFEGTCWLSSSDGPGYATSPCFCNGFTGWIVEE